MKLKRFLIFSMMLILCVFGLTGCNFGTSLNIKDIYYQAVENGYNGTYEEWLASIKGEKGETGTTPILSINPETNFWEVSYDNGQTWSSLGVKATGEVGERGTNGTNGVTPKLEVDAETNIWKVSYDNGETWESLGVKANGTDGTNGTNGTNGVTPKLAIDEETNMWKVSYDNGETWESLGVKASGTDGTNGTNGTNGVTPQVQINLITKNWQVSYDNGKTWQELPIRATGDNGQDGIDGKDAITYVPAIFYDYDGTKLYEFYYAYGTEVIYGGKTPERAQVVENENQVTNYVFDGWDKSLECITAPTIFTAKYKSATFEGYEVKFYDDKDQLLYSHYFKVNESAVYPYEEPYSYDGTYVYQFAGWDQSISKITSSLSVKAIMAKFTRAECGEYPQSLVTDATLISALDNITETDSNGYKSYNGEKYLAYESETYTSISGEEVAAGSHYYKVEPIKWRFLSRYSDNASIYVISKYILDYQKYNVYSTTASYNQTDYQNNTSEENEAIYSTNYKYSHIRNWLNTTFKTMAFGETDILKVVAVYNGDKTTNRAASDTTYDKVLLLSTGEIGATAHFKNEKDIMTTATDYAKAVLTNSPNGPYNLDGTFLTRTPFEGHAGEEASITHCYYVTSSGKFTVNNNVGYYLGVRPAVNFNINISE